MNLKEIGEGYMGGFGGSKGKNVVIMIAKKKKAK